MHYTNFETKLLLSKKVLPNILNFKKKVTCVTEKSIMISIKSAFLTCCLESIRKITLSLKTTYSSIVHQWYYIKN